MHHENANYWMMFRITIDRVMCSHTDNDVNGNTPEYGQHGCLKSVLECIAMGQHTSIFYSGGDHDVSRTKQTEATSGVLGEMMST